MLLQRVCYVFSCNTLCSKNEQERRNPMDTMAAGKNLDAYQRTELCNQSNYQLSSFSLYEWPNFRGWQTLLPFLSYDARWRKNNDSELAFLLIVCCSISRISTTFDKTSELIFSILLIPMSVVGMAANALIIYIILSSKKLK